MEHEFFPVDKLPPEKRIIETDGEPTLVDYYENDWGIYGYEIFFDLHPEDLRDKAVLDLGSSPSQTFAEEASRYNPEKVVSLDPLASEKPSDSLMIVKGRGENFPFAEQSFDLILALNSVPLYLHTEESIEHTFDQAIIALKHGGRAMFFPLAYIPLGEGFDESSQSVRAAKPLMPPYDNGLFDRIISRLSERHNISTQLTDFPYTDNEREEVKCLYRLTITKM